MTLGKDGYYLEDRDYNVINIVWIGGNGRGMLVCDKVKQTQFVIKRPIKSTEFDRQTLMKEARTLQEISHKNIICFYGAVEDNHTFSVFLEYANETCKLLIRSRPLNPIASCVIHFLCHYCSMVDTDKELIISVLICILLAINSSSCINQNTLSSLLGSTLYKKNACTKVCY